MSTELRYKASITNAIWEQWKLTNARVVAGKVEIEPGGNMQFIKAPNNEEDKAIPQKYKVVVTYNDDLPSLYSKSDYMFELHITPKKATGDEEPGRFKTITTSAHPNTRSGNILNKCITYVDAKGGTADLFTVILRNNSNAVITVVGVDVYPSYAVDDNTLTEIEQHIPSILHYTNSDRIVATTETNLVQMNVGTVSNTNLQIHFLANGKLSESADVVLDFKVDQEHLPYSPLEFTLPAGPFLLGIPANIMQVESGNNVLEINMSVSTGYADMQPFKVQCTVDGKGMLSKSSDAAPSVDSLLRVPIMDVTDGIDEIAMSFLQTQCEPIPHKSILILTPTDLMRYGRVREIIGIEQTRVAEDVWFGPTWENGYDEGLHEVFTYNTEIIKKAEGVLQFADSFAMSVNMKNTANWSRGDLYSIELDNSETLAYERLTITTQKQNIQLNSIAINDDTFTTGEGYFIKDGTINITTSNKHTSEINITNGDEELYTMGEIVVDETEFNEIKELK